MGSRQGPTEFVVDYGQWIFTERAEVERLQREDPWYAGSEIRETNGNAGPRYTVTVPGGKSPEDARQKLQSILDTYHTDIQQAETDGDKRLVIAGAVQAMYRAQIFPEGERQSTVLAVMNRMLLDAGMSPCIFPDPSRIFGLRPSMVATLIAGGQSLFRQTFPPPIEIVDAPKIDITDLRIDDDSSDDARVTPPSELRFATIENRLVADARDLMSQKEWTNAHQVYLRDLLEDANQPDVDVRYAQRQRKLEDREHTFTGNGQTMDLRKAEQVPNVIRTNVDLQDVVIRDRDITAEHAADGLARFLDPGLFDRIYDTVVSKYAPDLLTKPPPIDFSIQKRQGDNDQPVYEITMRGPMPQGMPNDDRYDLVVTLEVDATASYLYDTGSSYCRLESRQ